MPTGNELPLCREFFLGKNMTNEKERAVTKFVKAHEFNSNVAHGIVDYPELIKDPEYRDYGFRTALTLYKAGLYKTGVQPGTIYEITKQIKERVKVRNGRLQFIEMVTQTFDGRIPRSTVRHDVGLEIIKSMVGTGELASDGILLEEGVGGNNEQTAEISPMVELEESIPYTTIL